MTENDVIKALELCNNGICKGCPYCDVECCIAVCRRDALNLIKRQQAEIERYQKNEVEAMEVCEQMFVQLGELRECIAKDIIKAKKEAIKEFAERLCEGRVSNDPVVIAVKTELEMTEDK